MNLKLDNILKIRHANVELGGLTVLTGENNSGKSTIGKVLFSLLKAVNNVRMVDRAKTIALILKELQSIKRLMHTSNQPDYILNEVQELSVSLTDKIISFEHFKSSIAEDLERHKELPTRTKNMVRNSLGRIEQHLFKLDNPDIAVKNEFELIAKSEFMEPINSYSQNHSSIAFQDDTVIADTCNINFDFIEGKPAAVELHGVVSIEDVTYIESPLYLHILNTLRVTSPISTVSMRGLAGSFHKENIPFHLADMAEKMLGGSSDLLGMIEECINADAYKSLMHTIGSTIGGVFAVDSKTKQLSFEQQGHSVPAISVASGIKSFGVLQRLIQTGSVSTSKMLIWDEPEIHLHPEWQIVFCRLLVELVAQGIPIVVSSHSPYFVQALRYFASAKGIEKDVRYYMAEDWEDSGLAEIKEVTNDLNRVFTRLAAPLREIMNVDAVRNTMR